MVISFWLIVLKIIQGFVKKVKRTTFESQVDITRIFQFHRTFINGPDMLNNQDIFVITITPDIFLTTVFFFFLRALRGRVCSI
jgi:hypothetical protein